MPGVAQQPVRERQREGERQRAEHERATRDAGRRARTDASREIRHASVTIPCRKWHTERRAPVPLRARSPPRHAPRDGHARPDRAGLQGRDAVQRRRPSTRTSSSRAPARSGRPRPTRRAATGSCSNRRTTRCARTSRRSAKRPSRPRSASSPTVTGASTSHRHGHPLAERRGSRACPGRRSSSGPACRRGATRTFSDCSARSTSSYSGSPVSTSKRSRTLPFTCTTSSNVSRSRKRRIGLRPRVLPQALVPEPLPQLLGDVRRVRLDQAHRGLGGEARVRRGRVLRQLVDQLHHRGDRRVELEAALDVVGHPRDRRVGLARQRAAVTGARRSAARQPRARPATAGAGSGRCPRRRPRSTPCPGRPGP